MSNVVRLRRNTCVTRDHARNWLLVNYSEWPHDMVENIGDDLFHGWRFIRTDIGLVYFANCVDAGISEYEFNLEKGCISCE